MDKQPETGPASKSADISDRRKKKRSKRKRKADIAEGSPRSTDEADPSTKKQKQLQPLRGLVISVSTLKDGVVGKPAAEKDDDDGASGYHEVCQMSKGMGAQVTSQVSKRVQLLLCTRSAVEKATQRVRKAYKKKIPIVDVAWLLECRTSGKQVDISPFRLEDQAKDAISKRENADETGPVAEVDPNTGWTEAVSFGCSCVCHENGTEKDCQWCSTGCS